MTNRDRLELVREMVEFALDGGVSPTELLLTVGNAIQRSVPEAERLGILATPKCLALTLYLRRR